MRLSVFPDVNVWLALAYSKHAHHRIALDWYDFLEHGSTLFFCRHTQMGLLRLLTNQRVMGKDVKTPKQA